MRAIRTCRGLSFFISLLTMTAFLIGCPQQNTTSSTSDSASLSVSTFSSSASDREYPYTESQYGGTVITFESEQIGWKTDYSGNTEGANLYETVDGGNTWNPAQVEILPEMRNGLLEFRTYPVEWKGNHWEFALIALKNPGYPSWCYYEFSFNAEAAVWTWNDPEWPMPDGVNLIYFQDFVSAYFAESPEEYNYQNGLRDKTALFWLIQDTANFEERFGRELLTEDNRPIVSYEAVDKMAGYLYGDPNFDSKAFYSLSDHDEEVNYGTEDGFYYGYPSWRGEGYQAHVIDANAMEDATIEAVVATFYYVDGRMIYDADSPDTLFRRCVFKPIEAEGVQMFTLLTSEKIDRPSWYNGTPGPH